MKSEHEQPPVCPVCNRSDMVIPIVYGFPGEELFEESEKGLVMLGGCCVDDGNPGWYCKRDKKEFS